MTKTTIIKALAAISMTRDMLQQEIKDTKDTVTANTLREAVECLEQAAVNCGCSQVIDQNDSKKLSSLLSEFGLGDLWPQEEDLDK